MRSFDEYKIKSTIADTKDHCVISLSVYAGDSDVAKILCFYMKGGRTLIIGDIDTVPSYKKKGARPVKSSRSSKNTRRKEFPS